MADPRLALRGRRVLITGAAGGIGGATAAAMRHLGATVVGVDLQASPPEILAADVRDAEAVQHAVDEAAERMGGIDVLVNAAGIGIANDAGAFPDAAARRVLDVNLLGTWTATAAALPHLLRAHGHVVNIASGLAYVTVPFAVAYTASKRAVTAYSDTLRMEYRGRISVSTVYPGYVRTPIHDAPAAQGVSLEGAVPAEPVEYTVGAIIRSCVTRKRDLATGRGTAVGIFLGRHAPSLLDALVARRFERRFAGRERPAFLRSFDSETPDALSAPRSAPPAGSQR
ncbi:MAG TPA: SDR family NAD(P)-dependent oxidoreductase [Candidatus Dormibacteraeota bacterium]|nr:SDR family NAD(P)-dependent oxidoreductase [Candidatus Dormibacteraeota bacterium]